MKKRILSLLLVLCMVVGMLPASVFAADETDNTASETLNPAMFVMLPAAEGYSGDSFSWSSVKYASIVLQPGDGPLYYQTDASGHLKDGTAEDYNVKFSYEGKAAQMYLKGATIASETAGKAALYLGHPIVADDASRQANYEIIVEGNSFINQTLGNSDSAVLSSTVGTLTVTSVNDGKLAVKGLCTNDNGVFHSTGRLVLKNANLLVAGYNGAKVKHAIYAMQDVDITGGNVQAYAGGKGAAIHAAGNITVNAAKLTAYAHQYTSLEAAGDKGVTFKDSFVKTAAYTRKTTFAAAPNIEGYAGGLTVTTDTASPRSYGVTEDNNVNITFKTDPLTAVTFDKWDDTTKAAAEACLVFEIKPANTGSGTVKFPNAAYVDSKTDIRASYSMAMGDDTKYFTVSADGDPVQITEQASYKDYKLKLEYPVNGMLTLTLNGAELIGASRAGITLVTAANCPIKVVTEADSTVIASASSSSYYGKAFNIEGTGDVIFTSVNDATLTVSAKTTGSEGYINSAGNIIFENANMRIDGYTRDSGGTSYAVNAVGNVTVKGGSFVHERGYSLRSKAGSGAIKANNIYFEDTNVLFSTWSNLNSSWAPAYFNATAAEPIIQIKNSVFKAGIAYNHGDTAPGLFNVPPTVEYDGCCNAKGTRDIAALDAEGNFKAMTNPVTLKSGDANAINYRHVEIVTAETHALSGDFETDKDYHWGTCANCGIVIDKEAHTEGPALKEDEVPATETTEGSYNLVTRCLTCDKIMSSVPVTVPAVRRARVVFHTGEGTETDGVDRFILTVQNDGEALYYWTVNGALATTNADGLEANEENGYNIKFVYNPNDTAAKLYLSDADISNNANSALFYIGHGNVMDFSLEIVLEGENNKLDKTLKTSSIISINQTEGNTLAITGTGSLSIHSSINNSAEGIITSNRDLIIGKDATVNLYHTNRQYAQDIVMNEGADLVVNGTLNIWNASLRGYNADKPTYKVNPIITNGGGDVYINEGAKVSIVSRQSTHAFDVSGTLYVDAATLTVAMNGGYLFKSSNVDLKNVDHYVSLEAATISGTVPTALSYKNIPATELYNAENVLLYKYAAIVPHNHIPVDAWSSNETSHWQVCNGHCPEGKLHNEGPHVAGDEQMENLVEATARNEGSYDMVTRCVTCGYIMESEHFTLPKIKQAYVWFFYGDDDDQVPVAVVQGHAARYLYTKDGKIEKDAEGNVKEATEADYNIKLEYPEGAEKATLTFRNIELVNDNNGAPVQFGYGDNCTNFSVDIVLVGTNRITSNGTTNYHGAIESALDADQKVRILGDGTLNLFATTNSGGTGVIGVSNLTIEAGATVNAYNIGTGYPICVFAGSGNLTVNGNLGAYTLNNKTYNNTLSNGTVVQVPTIKAAGDIIINEGATVTIRSRQRSIAFDAGGDVYINNATVDALIGAALTTAETNPTSPGTSVFKKAPILSDGLDAQGTDNRSFIGEDYKIVEEPVLQRFDQFNANVLTYLYVKIAPHVHVFETKVSDKKAADATCEHGDKYYVQCRNCDLVSNTVTVETTAPKAHTWANATHTSGKVCSVCRKAYTYGNSPYYLVNLAGMGGDASDIYSNAYQLVRIGTDDNNVPKYQDETDVVEIAKALKATLDTYPIGTRFLNFTMVGKAFKGTYENGIYMDKGVKLVKDWLNEFLPVYKAIGGQMDGISVDLEFEYGRPYDLRNIYNGEHHAFYEIVDDVKYYIADKDIYKKIYNDPRFVSTGMKQMMEERGITFDDTAADPLYIVHTNSAAASAYNEAFYILMNRYIDEAMAPLRTYYPDAQLTDYDRGYSEAWQGLGMTDSDGNVNPTQGTSNRAGNSSNMSLYMMDPSHLTFNPSSGNYGQKPYGYNLGTFEGTPFNAAKWNVERFKQMLAATDDKKVSVWISEYNYFQTYNGETHGAYTNNSPYYAEAILHLGLANPSPFIGYVKPPANMDAETAFATYNKYLDTVNDLMLELTKVAGTDDRRPIELPYSWNDAYILSGMYAGGRNIWRITPKDGLEGFLEMSENGTPTFRAGGQTIVFPQGRIVETGEISNVGTCGYWVETPDGVNPVVISDENRYSEANGFTGTANRAELYVYDKYGYLVDASVANEGFTAYHVSWMNVDNTYKYLIIKNNGTEIDRVLMAPGQDSFVVGEIADGTNLLTVETVAATDYEPADPYASDDFFWADATKPNHTYKYVDNKDGTHDYVCDCGEEGAVAIDNEAHEFANDDDTTCDKCGHERVVGPVAAPTLKFGTPGLSIKDYIGLQISIKESLFNNANYTRAYYVYEQYSYNELDELTLVNTTEVDFSLTTTVGSTVYLVAECPVKAPQMSDVFTVTPYYEVNGVTYKGESVTSSVKEQAMTRINKNNAAKDICIAMLNYGAAAQEQFKYAIKHLANSDLTNAQKEIGTFEDANISGQNTYPAAGKPPVEGLSLGEVVNLQFGFKKTALDLTGCEVRYSIDGVPQEPVTKFTASGSYLVASIPVKPYDVRKDFTVNIYDANGALVYGEMIYSVEAFATTHKGKTTENIVIALMAYGDAVDAYFNG